MAYSSRHGTSCAQECMQGALTEGGWKRGCGEPSCHFQQVLASSFTRRTNMRTAPMATTYKWGHGSSSATSLSPHLPLRSLDRRVSQISLQGHEPTVLNIYTLFIPSPHDFWGLCTQSVQGERQRQETNEAHVHQRLTVDTIDVLLY